MRNESGFTLIELITVTAIVAVITATAIPNFVSWLPDRRIRSAVDDINSCAQLAKLQAVRENAEVAVRLDLGNDSLSVFVDDGAGGGVVSNAVRDGNELILKNVQLPAGVDLYKTTYGQPWFGFDGRGLPTDRRVGSIYLKNSKNTYRGLTINIMGNVRFIESDVEW